MDIFFLFLIIILHNIAVFLDNYSTFYAASNYKTIKIASVYAKRHQIDFLSRGFLFLVPPFLGVILLNRNLNIILYALLISSIFSLLVTYFQSFYFFKKNKFKWVFLFSYKNLILLIIGILVFFMYLYVPFYLNILAYFFGNSSLWIVQLNPALTSLSTFFVIYYLEPKLAEFIDALEHNKNYAILTEIVLTRIIGRVLILIFSIFMLLILYE